MTFFLKNISKKKLLAISLISTFIIIGLLVSIFYFGRRKIKEFKPSYAQTYRLVNEKISQSGAIIINLPSEIDKKIAQKNVKFYPEIEGQWMVSSNENEIVFKPKEKLKLDRYFLVEFNTTDGGVIRGDFLSVEDPEILAIFPKGGAEAPENSEISIVFNRPMVPLTTLGYLEEKNTPVEISPKTEGRFKWITTSNLQFIPKERLIRSSDYKVNIKPGLVSMDGIEIKGNESQFVTRKLRYFDLTKNQVIYNQPIYIYFNQPVDLEKTEKEIKLFNNNTGKEVPFIAEYGNKSGGSSIKSWEKIYGSKEISNFISKLVASIGFQININKEQNVDQSIIKIYNTKDRFGREKFWDFENRYSLDISKAYPAEGNIILNESRKTNFYITNPIAKISAESSRTQYASPEFFDPQGKLWIEFYEEIDLDKSRIKNQKIKEIGYGEKCAEEGKIFSSSIDCTKIPDKKIIYLTFKKEVIGLGEILGINFEKIVNIAGLTINKETIRKDIKSYPEFKIVGTSPEDNSAGASLTNFVICSNSPIFSPDQENYQDYFKANLDYELKNWSRSWQVGQKYQNEKCNTGEFHTDIRYGLMPLANYNLELKLEDVFGQKISRSLTFTTEEIENLYLNFYHLQNIYNVSSPQKTKLAYAVDNMNYVNLEICKLGALDFLSYINKKPSYYEPQSVISDCQQIVKKKIDLPEKYWIKNYFQVDIKNYFTDPIGYYILTFSHPNYTFRNWDGNQEILRPVYERTYLNITNISVAEKRIVPQYATYGIKEPLQSEQLKELSNLYWVTNFSNLEPIPGAIINLYRGDKTLGFAGSYTTDNQGIALAGVISDLNGVIISKNKDSTVLPNTQSRLNWATSAFSDRKIYLYTDKPIYRPGQQVSIKGIYRLGYDGNYEIYLDKKVNLKIFNSKSTEILNKDLEINDFGTFNTQLILEQNTPLGNYRICAKDFSCTYFDVQEYVPAPFEVKIKQDKEEYISKDNINLEVGANYYFGVPLEGGDVTYTISSQNYYFDRYSDGYFNFGSDWSYWSPYSYGDKFILRGQASLDSQGKATISQVLDLEKLFKDKEQRKSKIIVIDFTVKNLQGQSVSAQSSFVLHGGEFYLGLNSDKYFLGKNEKINFRVKSVDTQGKELKVRSINLKLYKTDWIYSKRQDAGGSYQYQWEKKRDLIKNYVFDTDDKGNYNQELQINQEGEYEVEVSAQDKRNNTISSIYNLYVYGEGVVNIRPTKNTELEIESEKVDLSMGEEGKIIIKSPYQKAKALISIERGKVFDYQIKEIPGNLYSFSFKVKEEYLPNVFVSVLLVSDKPEIKFGQVEFQINTDTKKLDIEVKSNKKYYLPGEEVVLDIATKDNSGKELPSEVSVAVVDLSVLALKGNPKKNPLIFFYGGFPLTVSTASNIKDILIEAEIPQSKGGGGAAEEALAVKKRGVFRETAFWQAVVKTDEKGKAQIRFTLPDNLTTWQAETLGVTLDTKIGVNYVEFVTRKELMVVPLKPRFIIPGDVFQIGVQIFNQSKENQKLTVKFDSQSLVLKDDFMEKKIDIDSEKTETIYFKVQAPAQIKKGEHNFIISAKNEKLEDTVEQSIPINPNNTYEVTATANYTTEPVSKEYVFLPDNIVKDEGEITIQSSGTLAVFLSDALNYLLQFPYGCSEQVASKLNAIAVVKKGLNLPNIGEKFKLEKIKYKNAEYSIEEVIDIGLAELYNNQQFDGGFSYWRQGQSDFYLTLHVVDALNNLSLAGFEINQNNLNKAANFLIKKITNDSNLYRDENNIILTAYIIFKLPKFTQNTFLRGKITEIANNNLFINDRISNASLAYLAIILEKGFPENLKNKVFATLDNRIDIDGRGAFLDTGKNIIWQYYETPIKNTALYLKAQSTNKSDNKILDKTLRWILNSRQKDGSWGSTNNTIAVIDAFTDFLQWKRETESDFNLDLFVNDKSEGSFDFNSKTILDQFRKEIPISVLKFNENNIVSFQKTNRNQLPNTLYYDLSLKYYLPIDQIPPRDEGFSITREFYRVDDKKNENPIREANVGEVLRGHLQITVPKSRNFVIVEDYIPAGMEIVNLDLATEQKSLLLEEEYQRDRNYWKAHFDRSLYPDFKEIHDDRIFLYMKSLGPGVYEFDYYVRALVKGKFTHLPVQVSEMYFPENFGRTDGRYFEIQ